MPVEDVATAVRVLVAEDSRRQCAELVEILKTLGARDIRIANTGHEAIRMASQFRPNLIVLDGLLPGMHGFEVARFIRGIDPAYQPRIIFTTAIYKNVRYENEARLKYGIDAYVVKPVTEEGLRMAMSRKLAA
ncbi:MAG TPA: response regulator [Thermoanaerobaculia bacterium]|nr:response regulator [Thermoanaerobaculia bacterium]